MRHHHFCNTLGKHGSSLRREADQDDAACLVAVSVRQRTKVLILGQKDSPLRSSERKDCFIAHPPLGFDDGGDIVTEVAESRDDDEVTTLIGEKPHQSLLSTVGLLADEHDFLVCDGVRSVSHRRVDILTRQLRIAIQKIGLGCALAELPQDQLHRHARATDHRFSEHDPRVHLNPISERHPGSLQDVILPRMSVPTGGNSPGADRMFNERRRI